MTSQHPDARLVRDYLAGDDQAFTRLYDRYERPLFSFILKIVRERAIAEDLFQLAWTKVLKALGRYDEQGKFSSWLFGIANNCCIDHLRRKDVSSRDHSYDESGLDVMPGEGANPEAQAIDQEQIRMLKDAIEEIPEDQKQVVLMRIYGDMPFKEIAQQLNCSINTVLGRMHYAVGNLKKIAKEKFEEL